MNWQIQMHEIMAKNWLYSNDRRQESASALYGCTNIYTVDVAFFAHWYPFEIKFKFTFLCKTPNFSYVFKFNALNLAVKHRLY